ncbi:hypothetical protein OC845_000531 [Tilletia horrida]|nr:hypothetical protein OC845_000531 [Tilletia horrida]
MLVLSHRGPRRPLAIAFLVISALTFILANPVAQLDSASALAARGSVYVGGKCTTNSNCYSKNCVNKVCQPQPVGGPCFENNNCASKSCKSGKCTAVPDGGKCVQTSDCINVCNLKGICYTPAPFSLEFPQPCARDDQCKYSRCRFYNTGITRDNITFGDIVCSPPTEDQGRACTSDANCPNSACLSSKNSTTKTCQIFPLGYACTRNNACTTGVCDPKTKKCGKPSTGHRCNNNAGCFSNDCDTNTCYGDQNSPDYDFCPYSSCNPVPYQGACRIDQDCSVGDGFICSKGTCDNPSYGVRR